MRTPLIVANWKMYKTLDEIRSFFQEFLPKVKGVKERQIVVCPPAVFLQEAHTLVQGTNVTIGAQNVHAELQGAYTGEISLPMIREFCGYVIVGHSERRRYNNETNDMINEKLKLIVHNDFHAILCVGERLEQRQFGDTNKAIEEQVKAALQGIPEKKIGNLTIAYEPVWSIGTGVNATPEQAQEVHFFIRGLLAKDYGDKAQELRIIYGGSVTPENIKELLQKDDVDGVLVGGASLNHEAFARIVDY